MLRPSTLLVLLACLVASTQARQLQQAKSTKNGPASLTCSNYVVMTTNIPALGTTEQLGDSVSASINCATRPAPLATLGGRCSIVCDEPADLRRVMITDQNLMAAPANYLKSSVKDKDVEFVDPVFCQLTVTDAPLKGECQLRAQALCCQA